ncbi:MAG: DUF6512 family protein [Lawsonibacter sp.]|nr:DUF6512 family protein [Lawsonibacter sp.]
MYYGKRQLILTGLAAVLLGTVLHFLYGWMPNAVTALVSPINESLWEHVKLLYWPYLLAALWLNRGRPGGARPWLFALPLMCLLMLALGYGYHILLGGEAMWVDFAIYLVTMGIGVWLPTRFSGPFSGIRWMLPAILVLVMGILIGLFTLWPPQFLLFADLSRIGAWLSIPY